MTRKEIKEKYPKAGELLVKRYNIDESLVDIRYFVEDYLGRNLYDFFDEQGIIISIWATLNFLGKHTGFRIKIDFTDVKDYKTRALAEEKAFTKAFEILESKL